MMKYKNEAVMKEPASVLETRGILHRHLEMIDNLEKEGNRRRLVLTPRLSARHIRRDKLQVMRFLLPRPGTRDGSGNKLLLDIKTNGELGRHSESVALSDLLLPKCAAANLCASPN